MVEMLVGIEALEGVVLTGLEHLRNGKIGSFEGELWTSFSWWDYRACNGA